MEEKTFHPPAEAEALFAEFAAARRRQFQARTPEELKRIHDEGKQLLARLKLAMGPGSEAGFAWLQQRMDDLRKDSEAWDSELRRSHA